MNSKTKNIIVLIAIISILVISSIAIVTKSSNQYNQYIYNYTGNIIETIHEKYPEIEEDIIKNILSDNIKSNNETIKKYGIDEQTIKWTETGAEIKQELLTKLIFIWIIAILVIILMIILNNKKHKRELNMLDEYCKKVIQGIETVKLEEQKEGMYSIVANDIYDMTILLKQKNDELVKNNQNIEKLIADISHQLKTPLTSLNMINDLLYTDLPEEKKKEFLDNMQKELEKIYWLINTLLNIAKLDSKTLILEKEKVKLHEIIEEIKKDFETMCEIRNSKIDIKVDPNTKIYCDKKWTKEALENIIKNALEHGSKNIKITSEQNHIYTQIIIKDDGEGIDKQDLPHIFERFYKSKNSKENSLGLGLAFAKSIIYNQDGDIKVKSKIGEGTSFIIKL